MSEYHINTDCVQAGYNPKNGEPRVLPIYQSTTFKYDSSEAMGDVFDLTSNGYIYTRLCNPTVDAVAEKIAALEGGVGAILTSSGQAASLYAILNIASSGDHIICSSALYGGTFNLFSVTMKKFGIDFTFIPSDSSSEEIQAAFCPNTKAVFAESLSNPTLDVLDIEKFAKVAHTNGVPLIIDNTFPTPVNCKPFQHGADVIVHSTSKYMDGHAVTLGGAIVDSGNFDWMQNDKFPGLSTPDESYHGLIHAEHFGKAAYVKKAVVHLMRDLGAMPSPQNAFLLNIGLETLFLRVQRHCSNALTIAEYFKNHEKIEWLKYPALKDNKYYNLAQKYMPNGTSGVISIGIKGGRKEAIRFINNLKLCAIATHVADCRTCVLHPASSTHRQLSDEQLRISGVGPELIRLSVGIEFVEDIIEDIDRALRQV